MPPLNRYSHHANRALAHAATLALGFQHPVQDTGHLLVGVLLAEGSIGSDVLLHLQLTAPLAGVYLKNLLPPSDVLPAPIPYAATLERALEQATEESDWLGQHYIGTEHFLLGITRNALGNAMDLLRLLAIPPEQVRRIIRQAISDGAKEFSLESIRANARLSELSKRVLNAAESRSLLLSHPIVGLGHLLWALANERRGISAGILEQSGLDIAALNAAMLRAEAPLFVSIEVALGEAINQAERLGSHYVGADHLLLALTLHPQGIAALSSLRVAADKANRLLTKHLR